MLRHDKEFCEDITYIFKQDPRKEPETLNPEPQASDVPGIPKAKDTHQRSTSLLGDFGSWSFGLRVIGF